MDVGLERPSHAFADGTHVQRVFAALAGEVELGLYVYQVDDPADPRTLRVAYANPASVAATGVAVVEIVGRPLRAAFPGLGGTTLPATFLEIALGGEAQDLGEVVYADRHVAAQVFSVRAFPLPHRCVGVSFTNLSTQRAAEQGAVETLESMSDAFFTLDTEWRFTYLNPQCDAILDRRREDLVGKGMWDEFPEGVGSRFHEAYHRAVRDQVPVHVEETYEPLGRVLEVRAYPVTGGLAVYFSDVTKQRAAEGRVRQGQRLEAIGRVTAGVAHDFNNLLTAIRGFAALGRDGCDDPLAVEYFDEIESAGRKATELTRQLLVFGRRQELRPAVTDVNDVVEGLASVLRGVIPPGVELELALSPTPVAVYVDPTQLEQVLLNLVTNGRDAIDSTGSITISTATKGPPGALYDVSVPSGWFQVADTGRGIAADVRAQIFDPFFSTKSAETGTGLGLATIYGIVSQSGGEIFVDSTPGTGTTMTVALPLG